MRVFSSFLLVAWLLPDLTFAQTRIELNPPLEPRLLPKLDDKLTTFDPTQVMIKRVENRFQIWSEKKMIKDFGGQEKDAIETVRIIRELRVNQYGSIPGAQPPFEYWLSDGITPRKGLSSKSFLPFDSKSLKVEKGFGVWLLRDTKQILYTFGNDEQAAEKALAICKQYRFNQVGYVGELTPTMTYLLEDPFQGIQQKNTNPNPLEVLQSVDRIGLLLPEIGLVGPKMSIDVRNFDVAQDRGEWWVVYKGNPIASFQKNELTARRTVRILQDYRITEYVKIGKSNFPLFLKSGQPLSRVPLGVNSIQFRPKSLTVKEVNGSWSLWDGNKPVINFANNEEDAKLTLKVIQHYQFDNLITQGNSHAGGLQILVKGR
jgi:hypothetical protein